MSRSKNIPIIDLFAGPGGLGEGFSAFCLSGGQNPFKVMLSIEKESTAHKTLLLRTFLRQFPENSFPEEYYKFLRNPNEPQEHKLSQLYGKYPNEFGVASRQAMHAELGPAERTRIKDTISSALDGSTEWVLIGGPPCQAYSLAGRSRNKGVSDYKPEDDRRQFLYLEYLQVIADHAPAMFVMENVKGLLSATVKNKQVFTRIVDDLRDPSQALMREGHRINLQGRNKTRARYRIYSVVQTDGSKSLVSSDYVVRMEQHGIPQARHRLILLGVREDLKQAQPPSLLKRAPISINHVLGGLPRLRSGLSSGQDNADNWVRVLHAARERRWFEASRKKAGAEVHNLLCELTQHVRQPNADRGAEFVPYTPNITHRPEWFLDKRLEGVCNHSSRSHITNDLYRYLYASCFAKIYGRSPVLSDFPADLLPEHSNVENALDGAYFADRFRVQLWGRPATTITSHISKDGHYYIHPDASQCRSLTVREAARIQTFPDNYFFCGPRTAQYVQVGNAVPPLLALQIAEIVHDVLKQAGAI